MATTNLAWLPVLLALGCIIVASVDQRYAARCIAYNLALVLLLAAAAIHLAGCSNRAPSGTVPTRTTPWCFRATVNGETAVGCTESRKLCKRANAMARRYGGMAEVSAVTECEVVR